MQRRGIGVACFVAVGALWLSGCSSSSETGSSSSSSSSSGETAAPPDTNANWTCLGKVKVPAATAATVTYDVSFVDPSNNKPVASVATKTCAKADVTCAAPLETATSDGAGLVALKNLPGGFDGFIASQAPGDLENLNFYPFPFFGNRQSQQLYWANAQISLVTQLGEVKRDPSLGFVGVQVHDCSEVPNGSPCYGEASCPAYLPGGVTLSIDNQDPRIVAGYIVYEGGGVTLSTKVTQTSALVGLGGFYNVPPGPVTLTAKVAATGQTVGVYKLFAKGNALSLISAVPNQ